MPELSALRKEHFKANCLAWAALNHFLPADLLRELSGALVDAVGPGQFRLDQLFDEKLLVGAEGFEFTGGPAVRGHRSSRAVPPAPYSILRLGE